jgi:hypothetical protein
MRVLGALAGTSSTIETESRDLRYTRELLYQQEVPKTTGMPMDIVLRRIESSLFNKAHFLYRLRQEYPEIEASSAVSVNAACGGWCMVA